MMDIGTELRGGCVLFTYVDKIRQEHGPLHTSRCSTCVADTAARNLVMSCYDLWSWRMTFGARCCHGNMFLFGAGSLRNEETRFTWTGQWELGYILNLTDLTTGLPWRCHFQYSKQPYPANHRNHCSPARSEYNSFQFFLRFMPGVESRSKINALPSGCFPQTGLWCSGVEATPLENADDDLGYYLNNFPESKSHTRVFGKVCIRVGLICFLARNFRLSTLAKPRSPGTC